MSDFTPLTCQETFRRLDDYLDRELSVEEVGRVQEHLQACAICAGEYEFEANVIAEVRAKLRRIEAPEDLLRRISRRLATVRDDESGRG